MSIIGAIVAIGLLILVHETGHFVVARLCGMRVDRFSVGFGPALLKVRWGETDFIFTPFILGGYVQIAGMTIAEEVEADDERAFPNRPVWQRFLTIFAGPATNYLFAVVLAFGLYSCAGVATGTAWYKVSDTKAGYDAHGKMLSGDRILSVNDEVVYRSHGRKPQKPLAANIREAMERQGVPVRVKVLRQGQEVTLPITPKLAVPENKLAAWVRERCGDPCATYHLGIMLDAQGDVERSDVGLGRAAWLALAYPVRRTKIILNDLYDWSRGRVEGELTGPVGIADVIQRQFQFGFVRVVLLLMLLNVYLGLINLLPLPALDGGRLVFLAYEMATRRRANPKVEATVHMVGIMVLLLLMVVVTYKDIARLLS